MGGRSEAVDPRRRAHEHIASMARSGIAGADEDDIGDACSSASARQEGHERPPEVAPKSLREERRRDGVVFGRPRDPETMKIARCATSLKPAGSLPAFDVPSGFTIDTILRSHPEWLGII